MKVDSEARLDASSTLVSAGGTAEKERKTCSDKVCGEMGVGFLETGLLGERMGDEPEPGDLLSSRADSGSSENSGCLVDSGMLSLRWTVSIVERGARRYAHVRFRCQLPRYGAGCLFTVGCGIDLVSLPWMSKSHCENLSRPPVESIGLRRNSQLGDSEQTRNSHYSSLYDRTYRMSRVQFAARSAVVTRGCQGNVN